MKAEQKVVMALLTALVLTGCRAEENRKPQAPTDGAETTQGFVPDAEVETVKDGEPEDDVNPPAEAVPAGLSGKAVGIEAHIKEVNGQELLISSDCDGFPGAFEVKVPESVFDTSLLVGGTSVRILMEEKEAGGSQKYQARSIELLQEQGQTPQAGEEKSLKSPPA